MVERPRIVVTRPLVGRWRETLEAAGEVERLSGAEGPSRERLIAGVRSADALLCLLTDDIDREVVEAGERLQVIGCCAVGVDNIDLRAAAERGVIVCHTPNVLTDATADLAMTLLLAVARRVIEADAYVRRGQFTGWRPDLLLGLELRGKRLGILGFGRIGRAMGRRAAGFGMEIAYWGRGPAAEPPRDYRAQYLALEDLVSSADILSLHLPLTPETEHLLNRDRLADTKPGAIVINTARGRLIEEAALVEALATGRLSGAGLDVYEGEPAVHPGLLKMDRVVLAPHIGSATSQTRAAMTLAVCQDVVRVLRGEPPQMKAGCSTKD